MELDPKAMELLGAYEKRSFVGYTVIQRRALKICHVALNHSGSCPFGNALSALGNHTCMHAMLSEH